MYSFQKLIENSELLFGRHIWGRFLHVLALGRLLFFGRLGRQCLSRVIFFSNRIVVDYIGLAVLDQLLLHCLIWVELFFGLQKLVQGDVSPIFNESVEVNFCLSVHQSVQTWRLLHPELFAQELNWHYVEVAPLHFKSHKHIVHLGADTVVSVFT